MIYAILLSAASEAMDGPELVTPERFEHAVVASSFGHQIKQASGLEYEVMHWTEDGWRNFWGQSAVEVIRKRWSGEGALKL